MLDESHPSLYPFGMVACVPRFGASNPNIPASPSRLGTAVTKSAGGSLCCLALEHSGRSQPFQLVHEGRKPPFGMEAEGFSFLPCSRTDSRARAPRDAISGFVMSLGSAKSVSRGWYKQESTGLHLFNSPQVYFYIKLGLYHCYYTNTLLH